jgi:hypothetical protein
MKIALLDKEFRWKAHESAVTGKLYARRDKFVHTQPDRSTNRPVTWSLKQIRRSARHSTEPREFTARPASAWP